MSCVTMVKAALARVLFGLHILVTVWKVVSQEDEDYWKLAIGILVLFLEGLHSLCYRKGQELTWFCPSVFIYLASIVPAIWILELKTNRRAILCSYINIVTDSALSGQKDTRKFDMLLDLMQMKKSEMEYANSYCKDLVTVSKEIQEERLIQIGDINLNIALKPELWTRILEQICLVVLILGRWLLPKGKLSRNQFSQLMLVYIGMAADIVEVFEAFRESKVMLEPSLTYAILGVWTWSLMQFCLVLGASHRGRKARLGMGEPSEGNSRPSRTGSFGGQTLDLSEEKKKQLKMDMIAISTSIVLQDGPFFCLRMILIFRFRVISHMNIFFTCKNTLVIMLQMYRLLVLCLERRPHYQRRSRIFSLIPQSGNPRPSSQSQLTEKSTKSIKIVEKEPNESEDVEVPVGSLVSNDTSAAIVPTAIALKKLSGLQQAPKPSHKRANTTTNTNRQNRPTRLKRRALTVKQISTASEELPFSTSEDVDSEPNPFSMNVPLPRAILVNRQLDQFSRQGSIRSLVSQASTESAVQMAVKDKEDKWREIHQKKNKRKEIQV